MHRAQKAGRRLGCSASLVIIAAPAEAMGGNTLHERQPGLRRWVVRRVVQHPRAQPPPNQRAALVGQLKPADEEKGRRMADARPGQWPCQ